MRRRIMILDAYNILHRVPAWKPMLDQSLEAARATLLGYCRRWMMARKDVWLFVAVFDGDSAITGGQSSAGPGVRVVYSASGEAADDRILEIVREFGHRFDYVVVSDDRYVTGSATQMGAAVMTSDAFGAVLNGGLARPRRTGKGNREYPGDGTEEALPPTVADGITESLRRIWGG